MIYVCFNVDQKKYKIGVISTVNLNHATPAATYAHQASRKSNYAIGQELVASNFDYFAGGALLKIGLLQYNSYMIFTYGGKK